MASVKAWRLGEQGIPAFPDDFDIERKAVLQATDIRSNHNKYYAIELHSAKPKGKPAFRVFTHYGRTDDLECNPDAGQRECRFFPTLAEAEAAYRAIYRQKTSPRKGYREVALASSRIGSERARGTNSGDVDTATLRRIAEVRGVDTSQVHVSPLHERVQNLVRYLYEESTRALTSTVAVNITAHGLETPLGVLTLGQIEKGEAILQELYGLFQKRATKRRREKVIELSGEFYSTIPHRIGRFRSQMRDAVIDSVEQFGEKAETLQLMRDMLQVNSEDESLLFESQVDKQYRALGCHVDWVAPDTSEFKELGRFVVKSQVRSKSVKVRNVFTVKREDEWAAFDQAVGNEQRLFHGSRVQNWVGILSRGIVLPKIAVSMGVHRTDAGWLGNGIYFGNAASTSAGYTSPGKGGSRFMAVARVALGKAKPYRKITYGLTAPPAGFDSCHGVRCTLLKPSQFFDDELVVYRTSQQRLEYLVEFTS